MKKRLTPTRALKLFFACCVMAAPTAVTAALPGTGAANPLVKSSEAPGTLPKNAEQTEVHSISTDMAPIMTLLIGHKKIRFTIRNIPDGERTTTTSDDPKIAKTIQLHAHEMRARVIQGNNIRPNDPIFVEIFKHHSEIKDVITDLPNGVTEDETSKNPQVVLLIRAHAISVAKFVRDGLPATHINTPLPQGYRPEP